MSELSGQVCILTGATGGIGAVMAQRLSAAGVRLVLASRSAEPLSALAASLPTESLSVPTDVTDPVALETLVEAAVSRWGRIDILINNAGIETFEHFHEGDPESISLAVAVNLTGPLRLCRLVIPHMLSAGGGRIVNVASVAGLAGVPHGVVYAATKAGLIAASRSLRLEYGAQNISVTALCPGFTHGGGMHERHKQEAGRAPVLMGSTTVDAVAEATLRVLRRGQALSVVNSMPMGGLRVIDALSPAAADALVDRISGPYMRQLAEARRDS